MPKSFWRHHHIQNTILCETQVQHQTMQMQSLRLCKGHNHPFRSCLSVTVWLWRNWASFPGSISDLCLMSSSVRRPSWWKCSDFNCSAFSFISPMKPEAPPPPPSLMEMIRIWSTNVFWEMESLSFSLSSATFWSWSPVTMPISFLHYIHYTVYQPLLFENVNGKNVFQFLVKEKKNIFKRIWKLLFFICMANL